MIIFQMVFVISCPVLTAFEILTRLVPKLEISVTVDVVREPPVRIIVDQLTCPAKVQFSFLEIFKIFSTV